MAELLQLYFGLILIVANLLLKVAVSFYISVINVRNALYGYTHLCAHFLFATFTIVTVTNFPHFLTPHHDNCLRRRFFSSSFFFFALLLLSFLARKCREKFG
jgi:asparagine N-glycosylation enzyme membrane subunit Stt3